MVRPPIVMFCALFGVCLWFVPHPEGVSTQAWHLFALFVTTIIGIIAKAMPIGSLAVVSLSICLLTKTLSTEESFSGFSNPVIWLVVVAFFVAQSFIKTGLGNRIAYVFVYLLGKKSLSLGYGLVFGDLMLALAIPSNAARAGGIMFPIVSSLARVFKSVPEMGSEKKIGAFLMLCSFHGSSITSAMFLTAMAANPLVVHFAAQHGVALTWSTWAIAASVPGLVSLLATPLLVYMLAPPELKETPAAREFSMLELKHMGRLSRKEQSLLVVFVFLLTGWIFPALVGGASATVVALAGLSLILLFGILSWEDVKGEKGAWDTLVWFAVLVTFASYLNKLGFTSYFASLVGQQIHSISWQLGALVLTVLYFLCHYFFASATAHVSALYGTFLGLGIHLGVPALPFALFLGFVSNIYCGLTHYSVGHAPIYFGAGFVDIKNWWRLGLIICATNLLIWMVVGSVWMGVLGYF